MMMGKKWQMRAYDVWAEEIVCFLREWCVGGGEREVILRL
jgi:hypothetical protein